MTQPQTDLPSWSLQSTAAPVSSHAAIRRGRPEEGQEQVRFAAALSRAAETPRAPQSGEAAGNEAHVRAPSRPEERQSGEAAVGIRNDNFFGEDGFGIADLIDIVNPLQHIPGVSTVYRAMTGDEISQGARLAGGTLYGGPLGFASALADNVSEDVTGRDVAGSVIAAISGEPDTAGAALADSGSAESADPAAQMAAIDPAAGEPRPAALPGEATVQRANAPAGNGMETTPAGVARTQASPLMAAQPVGSPFAAQPSGTSPMAVLRPPGAPTILNARAQAPTGGQDSAQSPATAAAQGVPNLSPEAANMLMRLSQQTQGADAPRAPMAGPPPKIAAPASAPEAAAAPMPRETADLAPSTAAATAEAEDARTQSAAYFDPVPAEDLPAAMMEALQKYEFMKQ